MTLSSFNPIDRARLHPIECRKPAVDFFEGALLGNGGLGAVVTTRPDAVAIHFGHNNVWDIRLAENHQDQIGAFQQIFDKVKAIPSDYATLDQDAWYRDYCALMAQNYAAPYPRPFPCGTLILGFDRREAELLGHRLDVATGMCEIFFLFADGRRGTLELFTDMTADRLWLRFVDDHGAPAPAPFERIRLLPDPDTPRELPPYTPVEDAASHRLAFRQQLPAQVNGPSARDRVFRLSASTLSALTNVSRINWEGVTVWMGPLERAISERDLFSAVIQLDEGLATDIDSSTGDVPAPDDAAFESARAASRQVWQAYWDKSGVALDDEFLERIWYHNLYFLNCGTRAGVNCPGLWANWSYRGIGSAWHGDYHMNYNTQQPFWCTFSANHVEKHLPYVDLVHFLLPISRKWARDYYGLRGAYFPHSAYPIEMAVMPYPVPTWGWEICETPWSVQSLWWHYLYTLDATFLRERAFEPIKDAVQFLVDYMRRPEAHGERWNNDGLYHIYPTSPPELYGLTPGFSRNYDCLVDLTLTKFVFKAYLQACDVLALQQNETELMDAVQDVLAHLPAYPTAPSAHGDVYVSVPGESAETVYNVPNPVMTVFPGEEHGLHSPPAEFQIAANSYRHQRNEGGNELIFLNLQGARLGLLDIERFKRQVQYCLLPNDACTDMALQVHGRYKDDTPYDFMAPMGVWFENFALPVVINECLLQSYNGILRIAPNWPASAGRAEFRTLRAVGAFLVSAAVADGAVEWVEIVSEAGAPLRMINPWKAMGVHCVTPRGERVLSGELIEIETQPGDIITLRSG